MSTLVVARVVFPLVLLAVTLGCGLAPEAVAGRPVPLALLPPVGLAVAVLLMSFATMTDATSSPCRSWWPSRPADSEPDTPASTGGRAVGGWRRGRCVRRLCRAGRRVRRSDVRRLVKLDDTATWLGTLDYALEHGTRVTGLAP